MSKHYDFLTSLPSSKKLQSSDTSELANTMRAIYGTVEKEEEKVESIEDVMVRVQAMRNTNKK